MYESLTMMQFLMDYTEGSLFTILILALVTGSKHSFNRFSFCTTDTAQTSRAPPFLSSSSPLRAASPLKSTVPL